MEQGSPDPGFGTDPYAVSPADACLGSLPKEAQPVISFSAVFFSCEEALYVHMRILTMEAYTGIPSQPLRME